MPMGVHKPGQGYWVRVLTAAAIGLIVVFGAMWGWSQAQIVRLPAKHWTFSTSGGDGIAAAGENVSLLRVQGESDVPVSFGSGRVVEYRAMSSGRADLVVDSFNTTEVRDEAADTVRVIVGDDPLNPAFTATVDGATAEPIFPQLYLQAGVAGSIILIGTLAIVWFVASNPRSSDFLIATDSEMKKVNWSTYKQIKGSTIVVIVAAFLIAGILFGIDMSFSWFFRTIDVLQS